MAPETLAPAGTQTPSAAVDAAAASPKATKGRQSRRLLHYKNTPPSPLDIVPPTPVKSPSSLLIEQGPGAKLKDIPNVFFKVSKRKADESLQLLHRILFKRRATVYHLKKNILQFSGFVWADNEKILKGRLKERLDKCNRDRLLELSELLDLQIRSSTKKEELVEKIFEFLQSPQSTRDIILAEKEKKGKRKRKTKAVSRTVKGGASSERKQKKRKASPGTELKKTKKRSRPVVEKGNEIQGSLSEKEDEDGQSSAPEENSDDPDFSYKTKLPKSGKLDAGLEEKDRVKSMQEDEAEKDQVKSMEEDELEKDQVKSMEEDEAEKDQVKSTEEDEADKDQVKSMDEDEVEKDQVKSMEEDEADKLDTSTLTLKSSEGQNATELKINGDDLPTSEENPSKPVIVEASLKDDDNDVEDVPPRKKGSSKGQTSKLSKPSTEKKAAASKKAPTKIAKTKLNSSPTEEKAAASKKAPTKIAKTKLNSSPTEEKAAASKKASAKIAKTKLNSSPTEEKAAASKKASAKIAKTQSDSSPTENSVDVTACDPPLPSKSKKVNKKKETSSENSAPGDSKPVKKPTAKNTTQDSIEEAPGDDKPVKKTAAKNTTQDSVKEQGKEKVSGKANAGPSKEELHSVISSILKEVDVNIATLADLLGKLGAHFKMDLMDRKKEVKQIIEEVMSSMTDEEDDSENEED